MNKAWVIIPAAGVGKRMQSDIPKQYLKVHHQTVLEHTLKCFLYHPEVAGIVVALHPKDPYWSELAVHSPIPLHVVDGGKERSDSVTNALDLLENLVISEQDYVLVHDAARPCLSQQDLQFLLDRRSSVGADGAILAMPVRDTMKRAGADIESIDHTVNRENLWHALTPQMFPVNTLKQALAKARNSGAEAVEITDEASAIEFMGGSPVLVEGSASNIKITHPTDLKLAEFFLAQLDPNQEGDS